MSKKVRTLICIFIFPYILLIMFLSIPLNLVVQLPHDIRPVDTSVILEGVEQNQMINTVSVVTFPYVTPFGLMLYNATQRATVRTPSIVESNLTLAERNRRGRLQMESSLELAIINAYTLAAQYELDTKQATSIFLDYQFVGLRVDYRDPQVADRLDIDDLIVAVNGISGNQNLMSQQFTSALNLSIDIQRGNNIVTVEITNSEDFIWSFFPKHTINQETSNPRFSFPVLGTFIGGPSGGMMMTLSLYADLIGYRVDTLIVGTGTIRFDGTVGPIGGVVQKVFAALDNGANYFILPSQHYFEVIHLADRIKFFPVDNIKQAIGALHEILN